MKIIIYVLIILISFVLTFKVLFKLTLSKEINSDLFIKYLLASGTNNMLGDKSSFGDFIAANFGTSTLIKLGLNNMMGDMSVAGYTFSDDEEGNAGAHTDYIPDPNPVEIKEPLVYIYNTHQRENYSMENLAPYNIKPNVLMASYVFRERLNDLGIPTIVETNDVTEILRVNSWAYAYSYKASRLLIEDAINKNKSIKYIIDIHRDSVRYEATTAEIDGVRYAKLLFLVGGENPNYGKNLELANKVNDIIKATSSSLTRGIMIKEGPGVNGIYNQDISPNVMLIEVGGQYNSIEEVNNTINILAKAIHELIEGEL